MKPIAPGLMFCPGCLKNRKGKGLGELAVDELVAVFEHPSQAVLAIVKGVLTDEGIESVIRTYNNPYGPWSGVMIEGHLDNIMVRREDAEAALHVIEQLEVNG